MEAHPSDLPDPSDPSDVFEDWPVPHRRARCPQCGTHFEVDADSGSRLACPSCGASLARPSQAAGGDPLVGQTLGPFEIVEAIARGGMGAVYKARQTTLDRFVAVKVLPPSLARNAAFVQRFQREARSAAAVKHPNIIDMIDVGEDRGIHYLAMELVEGESLQDIVTREGRLAAERALALLKQVAAALAKAHAAGICHRDIKPANILVQADGTAKVADFGLAKRPESDVSVTDTGQALGTPLYMPPEVARGQPHEARSDLYSLGATFYRVLAGKPPFEGKTSAELIVKHIEAPVTPLKEVAPDVPAPLAHLIHRLLRKNPAERYESAEKLLEAVERVEADLAAARTEATPPTPTAVTRPHHPLRQEPTPRASRTTLILAGLTALTTLALLLVLLLGGKRKAPERAVSPETGTPPKQTNETPAVSPQPPLPRSKIEKPKPKIAIPLKAKSPAWEADWQAAVAKADALARQTRFGDAVQEYQALQSRISDPALRDRVQEALAALRRQADASFRELETHVGDLLDANASREARQALEPALAGYGLPLLAERAKRLLARIEEGERQGQHVARWMEIVERCHQLIQKGEFDRAEKLLEDARGIELANLPERLARQAARIQEARKAAADRALAAYAQESDQLWARFKKREYQDAEKRLAELAANADYKLAAVPLQADAAAARLLREFWQVVEQKLAASRGKFVAFPGAAGTIEAVASGKVTLKAGENVRQRDLVEFTAKQVLTYTDLGTDARARLLEGVFRLAEGEGLDEAEKALAAAGDSPEVACFQKRLAALKAAAPRPEPPAKSTPPAEAAPRPAPKPPSDKDTDPDKAGTWVSLFNGKDTTGWKATGNGWVVERGVLAWRPGAGTLLTEEEFGDFVLQLEFRLDKGSNSGVFFRVADPRNPVPTAIELQLFDTYGQRPVDSHSCGALYDCLAPRTNAVKPPGFWNDLTLACKGTRVLIKLNDEKVIDTDLSQWAVPGKNPDGTRNKLARALKDLPREGRIGLQDHGTAISFRNIRIKRLAP